MAYQKSPGRTLSSRPWSAVAVYEAQLTTTDEALAAATVLFDALGSSALDLSLALDWHWRNARAITSHNPRVYKERLVGAWHLNGTPPAVYGSEKPAADSAVSPPGEP
jgi:alkylation response protein AidB-like acyl-CoA dehydrogenase